MYKEFNLERCQWNETQQCDAVWQYNTIHHSAQIQYKSKGSVIIQYSAKIRNTVLKLCQLWKMFKWWIWKWWVITKLVQSVCMKKKYWQICQQWVCCAISLRGLLLSAVKCSCVECLCCGKRGSEMWLLSLTSCFLSERKLRIQWWVCGDTTSCLGLSTSRSGMLVLNAVLKSRNRMCSQCKKCSQSHTVKCMTEPSQWRHPQIWVNHACSHYFLKRFSSFILGSMLNMIKHNHPYSSPCYVYYII